MNVSGIPLLRTTIILIGIIILVASIFYLPYLANETATNFPEYAHLKYPILIGLYLTLLPFNYALYQSLKLLTHIKRNQVFTVLSTKALRMIRNSAFIIIGIYLLGGLFLFIQNALHPGIILLGLVIVFTSTVICAFSGLLQKVLQKAIDMKSENELTI
ncbi:membrane protein [Bacillus sp. JCM 19046]|uniref:CDP-diglyceride synthetase n=1 Tax=Shouchella xiaoxiensis TaxID=766895 RepID=A0ABS2SN30_9BACI|nr:DUF2975 domain-containing protein [Shouchella xiaoxiensis]MBM7836927.1 CDP-diglyceride synthetase [Shouchella xiaoxiensis]GAF11096.1 membrane protein [Bacillus sp. JCM 19045]GAF17107.1 membrane protein [Bacillus sp. JCM 19046]